MPRAPLPSRLTKEHFERDLKVPVTPAMAGILRQADFVAKRKPTAEAQQEFESVVMERVQAVFKSLPAFDWSLMNLDTLTSRADLISECRALLGKAGTQVAYGMSSSRVMPALPPNFSGNSGPSSPTTDRSVWIRESAIARTTLIDEAFTLAGAQHRALVQRAIAQLDAQVSVLQFSYKGRTAVDILARAGLQQQQPGGARPPPPPAGHNPAIQVPTMQMANRQQQFLIPSPSLPPSQYPPLPGSVSILQQVYSQYPPGVQPGGHPQQHGAGLGRVVVPPPVVSMAKNPTVRQVASATSRQQQQQHTIDSSSYGSTGAPQRRATSADNGLLDDYFGRQKRDRSPPSTQRSSQYSLSGGLSRDLRAALHGRREVKVGGFLVGKCTDMERRYSRETPTAHDIRPRRILEKAFAYIVNKSLTHPDFLAAPQEGKVYLSHQLKGMRQDIKVQNLTDAFSVSVYEYHAKLAIEIDETMELVQCQTALKHFYGNGHFGKEGALTAEEFTCYRLLYLACAGESRLTDEVTTLQLASKAARVQEEDDHNGVDAATATVGARGGPTSGTPSAAGSDGEFSEGDFSPSSSVLPANDICTSFSWFSIKTTSLAASDQQKESEAKSLVPKTATDRLFYHEKTRRMMQLCAAILTSDGLEFNRLISMVDPESSTLAGKKNNTVPTQDTVWWPMTRKMLSHYMQKIRISWMSRLLPSFKGNLSMRFLMRALAFVPLTEVGGSAEAPPLTIEVGTAVKGTKKNTKKKSSDAAAQQSSPLAQVVMAGPQWLDGSAVVAEEEMFKLFQLLKLLQPAKFSFHREVVCAVQQQFGGPVIDATELKNAVAQHLTNLNTRRDF